MDTENQVLETTDQNMDADDEQFITDRAQEEKERERERELEQERAKQRAKKRRLIPPFIMLLAGSIVSIFMFVSHYKLRDMLIVLLCVLIFFDILGEVIKWMLDRFEAQIEQERMDEGEVIEKEPDEEGDGSGRLSDLSAGRES